MKLEDGSIKNDIIVNPYQESNDYSYTLEETNSDNIIQCNPDLIKSYDILKSTPVKHKGRFYQQILSKAGNIRSQSMPNFVEQQKQCDMDVADICDIKAKLLYDSASPPESPNKESWFNSWPEKVSGYRITAVRAGDVKNLVKSNSSLYVSLLPSNNQNEDCKNNTHGKISLNDALQNISLAYSPVTRQLHLIESNDKMEQKENNNVSSASLENSDKCYQRTSNESFFNSSNSSGPPSPSSSGSLLEDKNLVEDETSIKLKKKALSNIFKRNLFSWKSCTSEENVGKWKFFSKTSGAESDVSPQHSKRCARIVASSTALIQHIRPSHLPAKPEDEEQRHREEYKAIIMAAKKKEAQTNAAKEKQQKLLLEIEEQLALATKHFIYKVLPNWDVMYNTRKTRDFWWQGLPSAVRGKVWKLAIGNELNLTQQLYEICLERAQNHLNRPESSCGSSNIDEESSMDLIQLDISRTFPQLCIFQEGGPYSDVLHSLLAAYVCYRPDIGYVQGMSYIAAIFILNMDELDAFICFSNLLNRTLHLATFTLDQNLMQCYYNAYKEVFNYNLPKLYGHFEKCGLTPDLYLLDWVYTVFAKAMPLDVACRVWDVYLRDGDEFIFRTALGILHLHQTVLMEMDFLHGAKFLTHLPDDLSSELLFKSIQTMNTCIGKQTFNQIVERHKQTAAVDL
ncbi:TBC1 domain family member 14 [Agrilus planipennis]|uniref:TBC1 domain family member 14 n=1 Tax=Agrilus planipennis TaxID=224129 RepID=A0A1W4WEZ2_AGRPL|nr:TBC1 domain family member 14 [Agrilus planipennis]